ncbi:XdhC family protein [Spongiibacter nanhainus]|uniref:XdhC family protein n=1 Tax=Spongiibacter nanhainus TaxID=2794344 RepID=A0A7T4UNP2_9GAMM|nr:XdhC family protein [Spongiibacter nanhainus]QQD16776.1 XdhC family protein [Spongiibacter nanhainus]
MKTVDQLVFEAAYSHLEQGNYGFLCTIVSTVGASPRPLGSLLFLGNDGEVTGSLSGGCIEDDLLERLLGNEPTSHAPEIIEYGVTPEENERFGLPCGGRMQVMVECLMPGSQQQVDLLCLAGALAGRRGVRRIVDLEQGGWQIDDIDHCETLKLSDSLLQQDFGPRYQLLLVGANELARCIAELALAMDYRVLVCDPREERLQQWHCLGADTVCQMPDDAVREHATDPYSIVITLTHDPRIDDMALMEALQSSTLFYVGALGSQRTSDKRRQRLLQLELNESQIARLHAPVGLPIGSKSAMEIAVAVMAELTQCRAKAKRAAAERQSS